MNEQKPVTISPLEPTPHPERPLGLLALVTIALGNVSAPPFTPFRRPLRL